MPRGYRTPPSHVYVHIYTHHAKHPHAQGEVKSQNDSLDDRQAAWLHILTAAGLRAKVIHVKDPVPVAVAGAE